MDTKLRHNKKFVWITSVLLLVLGVIPVYLLLAYGNYTHDNLTIVQISIGYMWLWCFGVTIYWHYKNVISRSLFVRSIIVLIFGALFIVFLPYFFSDAFTDLFWK